MCKKFRGESLFEGVDIAVMPGESLGIVGANGCGKSTLLKICAGVESPSSGQVTIRGSVGYCPQAADLGWYLTPRDHFKWFGAGAGWSAADSDARAEAIAESLEWQVAQRQVRHLSGGTAQKLNVTCAALSGPRLMLLDEPYQGFDEGSYLDFWRLVDEWCARGVAVVVVTHLLHELDRVDAVFDLGAVGA